MRRLFAPVAVVALAAPLSAQAAKPSFVGSWVLDAAKSESPEMPLPAAISWTFTQHGDTLVMARETTYEEGGAKLASTITVGMDGKAWPNKVPQPDGSTREASYAITWEGATMVMTILSKVDETPVVQTDRFTKSADGASISVARELSADGEIVAKATMVFAKRP